MPGLMEGTAQQAHIELAKLKEVLHHASLVFLAIDDSGKFLVVEGGALSFWPEEGRPRLGGSMWDLLETSPDLVDGFDKALRGQQQACRTYVGDRIFELSFSSGSAGASVRACCVGQEITERAEAEKQRIAEQLATFEQQRRIADDFRTLIERLPLGIVVTRGNRIVLSNVSAVQCLHWGDSSTSIGMDFSQFFAPEKRPLLVSEPDIPNELVRLGEVQLATGDGASLLADVQRVGIEFEGSPASLFAIRDITDVHRMEQDLRQAQRLEAIGRLAAGIAHEINTPIQFIGDNAGFLSRAIADVSAYVSFLEENLQDGSAEVRQAIADRKDALDVAFVEEEAPKAVANILEGVARVAKIVAAMKEHAHPGRAEKSLCDLNRAIETTVVVATNEWKYVATVATDLEQLPMVRCRLGGINQVFLNLLVNAAHAIGARRPATDEKGHISIRSFVEGEMAVFAISDDGSGIPPEVGEHIFDPFFTTKEVGKGTGQGLTLARRVVVEEHGGKLDFTSEVGKGTTFFVRLPFQ